MDLKKYKQYSAEDFILDDDFVNSILHSNSKDKQLWEEFIKNHPEQKEAVNEAIQFIQSVIIEEPSIPRENLQKIFNKINRSERSFRALVYNWLKIAATLFILLSAGALFYFLSESRSPLSSSLTEVNLSQKGKIILPDGRINEFETDETNIKQTDSKEITINNDTLRITDNSAREEISEMAQVIIPYGKRSQITLSDGTRIWLNSGSHLAYPVEFKKNRREIYLSGEAFFDVTPDHNKPFYVITEDMRVTVTGTRFNVTSYKSDSTTQTVLCSGKVIAEKNTRFAKSVELSPGERIIYNKTSKTLEKSVVDVNLYSTWMDGYLIFKNEPVSSIFKKLERYYNKEILIIGNPEKITFTGKLYLSDKLENVLKNIAFSASFTVENDQESFIIKTNRL